MASADPVALAHARLLTDRSLQFAWSAAKPPPTPPSWLTSLLKFIGHLLEIAAPVLKIGLWAVLALGLIGVAIVFIRQLIGPSGRRPGGQGALNLQGLGASAADAAVRAAVRLAEADRLAAEGRYEQAAHILLLRGVADVESGRPGRIRPSFTSRDIAALPDLPPEPRAAFAMIAKVVERALFGGRQVDAQAWRACRDAYEALVRPEAWIRPGAA